MTDRDRAIEHLLRNAAATPPRDPSASCLDADTLAAWVDGRLTRTELSAAEAHAAGCARCQAMLAVMARTAESGEEAAQLVVPRRSLWRMLPWAGPLAAAATAAAIYVAVRPGLDIANERAERSAATQTTSTAAPAQEALQPRAELEPATPSPQAAPRATAPARSDRDAEQDQSARAKQNAANAPSERRSADSAAKPTAKDVAVADKPAVSPDQQSKEAAARAPSAPPPQVPVAVTDERTAPPPPPVPPKTADEAKRREAFAVGGAAAAPAGVRADMLLDRAGAPLVIQSPDLDIRWRVVGGNVVQRSTDRGRTWSTQATGTTKAIAAGFSPSTTVCWIVGAGGLVAVTTDGATWTTVPFPHSIDLTNVQASSADAAVVFAADGRTFTTADRGKSWK